MEFLKYALPAAMMVGCAQLPDAGICEDKAAAVSASDYEDGEAELTCYGTATPIDRSDPELCKAVDRTGGELRVTIDIGKTGEPEEELALVAEYDCEGPGESIYGTAFELVVSGSVTGSDDDAYVVSSVISTECGPDATINAEVYVVDFNEKRARQACEKVYAGWEMAIYDDGSASVEIKGNTPVDYCADDTTSGYAQYCDGYSN
jgi:hypothetical protein